MPRRLTALFTAVICCALLTPVVRAAPGAASGAAPGADADADAVKAKLVKTYAGLNTYASTTRFEMRQKEGGWLSTQSGDFHVALDRKGGKFSYVKPDLRVVDDGTKLYARANQVAERYLEMAAPQTLSFDTVAEQIQFALKPPPVELALLLSNDPIKDMHGGAEIMSVKALPPDPADTLKRPGLESTSTLGKLTLRIDPASGLVTSADMELNLAGIPAGDGVSLHYDIKPGKADQALPADQFAFAKEGLSPAASFKAWMGGEAGGEAQGQDNDPAVAMEGKPAPALALDTLEGKPYKLADDKSSVIILDFWATWCGPCKVWMPHLEKIQAWAKKEHKSVAIYAVNAHEPTDLVKRFVKDQNVAIPVLMDPDGKVGDAFAIDGWPTTVIIAKGQIIHVHPGINEDSEALVIKQINELLAAPAIQPAK